LFYNPPEVTKVGINSKSLVAVYGSLSAKTKKYSKGLFIHYFHHSFWILNGFVKFGNEPKPIGKWGQLRISSK
jgi:hypothetical protein